MRCRDDPRLRRAAKWLAPFELTCSHAVALRGPIRSKGVGKMRKNVMRTLLVSLSALGLIVLTGCDSPIPKAVGSPEKLTIGTYAGDTSALLWIAKGRGYFTEEGVDVQFKVQESGRASFADLLAGKVDLVTVAEFVFVRQVVERPDLRILAVVANTSQLKLVARKDRGVTQVSDLSNKRIGLVRGSIAEYYLQLFLITRHLPYQGDQLVDLPPSEQVEAIARGDIDAAIVWEPFARQMQEKLADNAVTWPAQSGQDYYWLLVGTEDTLRKRSAAIRRVLAALASAEDFIKNNGNEAKRIVASQLGSAHMPDLWETSSFELTLSRPVVLAMESELRWMNSMNGVREFKMPDFLDVIYFDALKSVRPEKIKMLH